MQVIGLPEDVKQTVLELFPVYQQDATLTTSLELYYGKKPPAVPPPPPYRPLSTFGLDAPSAHHSPLRGKNRQSPQAPFPTRSGNLGASSSAAGGARAFVPTSALESLGALKSAPGVQAGLEGLLTLYSDGSKSSTELFELFSRLAASTESVLRQAHGLAQPWRGGTVPDTKEKLSGTGGTPTYPLTALSANAAPCQLPYSSLAGPTSSSETEIAHMQCAELGLKEKGCAPQSFTQDVSSKFPCVKHLSAAVDADVGTLLDTRSAAPTSFLSRDALGNPAALPLSTTRLDPSAPVFHPAKQRSSADNTKGDVAQEQRRSLPWNPFATYHPHAQISTAASMRDVSNDNDAKNYSCVVEGTDGRHSMELSQLLQGGGEEAATPGAERLGAPLSSPAKTAGQRAFCCPPPGFSCGGVEFQGNASRYVASRVPSDCFQSGAEAMSCGSNRRQSGGSAVDVPDSVFAGLRKQDGVSQRPSACPSSGNRDADMGRVESGGGVTGQASLEAGQLDLSEENRMTLGNSQLRAGPATPGALRTTPVATEEVSGEMERTPDVRCGSSASIDSFLPGQICSMLQDVPACSRATQASAFSNNVREGEGTVSSSLFCKSLDDPRLEWGGLGPLAPSVTGTLACESGGVDVHLTPQSCWRFVAPLGKRGTSSSDSRGSGSGSSSLAFDGPKQLPSIPSSHLFPESLASGGLLSVTGGTDFLSDGDDLARCVKQILSSSSGTQNSVASATGERRTNAEFSVSAAAFAEAVGTLRRGGPGEEGGMPVYQSDQDKNDGGAGVPVACSAGNSRAGKESMSSRGISSAVERWAKKLVVPRQDAKNPDSAAEEMCSVRMDVSLGEVRRGSGVFSFSTVRKNDKGWNPDQRALPHFIVQQARFQEKRVPEAADTGT